MTVQEPKTKNSGLTHLVVHRIPLKVLAQVRFLPKLACPQVVWLVVLAQVYPAFR